jgi:hypothetical protein
MGAQYYFLKNPDRFYIVLKQGKAMEFALKNGALCYGASADLSALIEKEHFPSEEAEVWSTSLRFSSITDVVAVNASNQHPLAFPVNVSELNEAVAIGIKTLAERKEPQEDLLLVDAERIFLRGAYIWRLTFKPARQFPADPVKREITKGGEIFLNINLKTKEAEVRYGR